MDEKFIRARMLLGDAAMEKLKSSHVALFGLGGVGSWCAEALARSGVGEMTVVDEDFIGESNINRQMCATVSTLGKSKAEAVAARLLDINPRLVLHPVRARYDAGSRESFFMRDYDYIIDAIDLVACKLDLIETALAHKMPIISALGTGNKTDASLLRVADISDTKGCPLAKVVRRELRKRGIERHTVVYSPERALDAEQLETPPPGRRSVPGSLVWVPACAGLLLAQHAVLELAGAIDEQ